MAEIPPNSGGDYGLLNLIQHVAWQQAAAARATMNVAARAQAMRAEGIPIAWGASEPLPDLMIQATIVVFGDKTNEGQLVEGVAIPWFEILREVERNPRFLHEVNWRTLEELIAGAYKREGWPQVELTPRSGDKGRDVIATRPGIGAIRFVDQAKAYKPGHKVPADDVRALAGVLLRDQNVSKGIVTTTSTFAPGIEEEMKALIPYRLELKDGKQLREWLTGLIRR